jgi:cysteinyl-tRNA synthetase
MVNYRCAQVATICPMDDFLLFDTFSKSKLRQRPPEQGKPFKIYSCGPTVYRYVHLGNLRTFLLSDLVRRVAEYAGYTVFQVMNITDVGHLEDERLDQGRDKLLIAAEVEGKTPEEIADYYSKAFFSDIARVGILPADVYPRASDHIPQMIELIEELLRKGHAYVADGNVYFDVASCESYGSLSGNTLGNLVAGHRKHTHDPNKRRPEDFLLWRKAGPGRLVKFDSPFGEGFPGWHIECSAMSLAYLGPDIDVHTGGVDLIFPHHECEIAQSEGAVGRRVVRTWVHGAYLLQAGQKMAKSKLNDLRITTLEEEGGDPLAFRYLCFTARYRKQLEFSWEALSASDRALRKLRERVEDLGSDGSEVSPAETRDWESRFRSAIFDDLDMPAALQVVHALVRDRSTPPSVKAHLLARWDSVLGLQLLPQEPRGLRDFERSPRAQKQESEGSGTLSEGEIQRLLDERARARSVGDYVTADSIREQLLAAGIEVQDTPEGTTWRIANPKASGS